MSLGRPARVRFGLYWLTRGHRELLIHCRLCWKKNIPTSRTEEIIVHMTEIDQQDAVLLVEGISQVH